MATTMLIVLALASLSLTLAQSNWDQQARDRVLKYHNDRRAEENACNMRKMVYNMTLEAQAKTWAEGCLFEHEMIRGRGENLAYTSKTGDELTLAVEMNELWYQETLEYDLESNVCSGVCGHYTQMVWAETTDVGCYSTRCQFGYYLVCFYSPQGNMNGRRPFTRDCPADQKCPENTVYQNGLCYSDAECPDKREYCKRWAKLYYCNNRNYKRYMQITCQKSCQTCNDPNDAPL